MDQSNDQSNDVVNTLKLMLICLIIFTMFLVMFSMPAIPQDPKYHNFADKRTIAGIPNCFDVLSNVLFFISGVYGVYMLMWYSNTAFVVKYSQGNIRDYSDTVPWWVMFISSTMVALGSAYYHWNPTTHTLFWDRLPMTISFMSIVDIIVAERVSATIARKMYVPLLTTGIVSVVWWTITEYYDAGDLRLYALVQFTPVVLTPVLLGLYSNKYTHGTYMMLTVFCYIAAKFAEMFDWEIYRMTNHIVSGHTLKHLIAGLGLMSLPYMLQHRRSSSYKQKHN